VRRERHAAFRFAAVIVAPGEPHILNKVVETEVPLGGFRKRLDPMYEFHTRRRIGVHHIRVAATMSAIIFAGVLPTVSPLKHSRRNFPVRWYCPNEIGEHFAQNKGATGMVRAATPATVR
jgi:hypothetical protein